MRLSPRSNRIALALAVAALAAGMGGCKLFGKKSELYTQSVESRQQWINTLDEMAALHPQQVIPGHYLGTPPAGDRAITFTRDYLTQFEQALNAHKDSAGVIKVRSW